MFILPIFCTAAALSNVWYMFISTILSLILECLDVVFLYLRAASLVVYIIR
jgi:hypothetical protein